MNKMNELVKDLTGRAYHILLRKGAQCSDWRMKKPNWPMPGDPRRHLVAIWTNYVHFRAA